MRSWVASFFPPKADFASDSSMRQTTDGGDQFICKKGKGAAQRAALNSPFVKTD